MFSESETSVVDEDSNSDDLEYIQIVIRNQLIGMCMIIMMCL